MGQVLNSRTSLNITCGWLSTRFNPSDLPKVLVALPGGADGRREAGMQTARHDRGEHSALLPYGKGGGEGALPGGRRPVPRCYPGLQVDRAFRGRDRMSCAE